MTEWANGIATEYDWGHRGGCEGPGQPRRYLFLDKQKKVIC